MAAKQEKATPEPETKPEDAFIAKLQAAIESILDMTIGGESGIKASDMNAAISNGIKLLIAKDRLSGGEDGGSWWGQEESE